MASSPRIEELRKKFDENPRRYFAPLANEYRKSGDIDQAIFICQEYLPQQPGHMSGHIVYGQALFEAHQHDEARTVFETALTLDPENLIALRHLGDIAREMGDPMGARGWYQRVLEADPRNEEIAVILAGMSAGAPGQPAQSAVDEPLATAPAESPLADFAALVDDIEAETTHAAAETAASELTQPHVTFDSGEPAASEDDASFDFALELDSPVPGTAAAAEEETASPAVLSLDGLEATHHEPSPASGQESAFGPLDGLDVLDAGVSEPEAGVQAPVSAASYFPPRAEEVPASTDGEPAGAPAEFDVLFEEPLAGVEAPASAAPAPFVTETMAELYVRQGHHEEAIAVYRQLLTERSDDATLHARLAELEPLAAAAANGAPSHPGTTIRDFLGAVAARRPRSAHTAGEPAYEQGRPHDAVEDHAGAWALPAAEHAPEPTAEPVEADALGAAEYLPESVMEASAEQYGETAEPEALDDSAGGVVFGEEYGSADVGNHDADALDDLDVIGIEQIPEAPAPARYATPASASSTVGGSIDALFGGTPPAYEDVQAASALAGAFAGSGAELDGGEFVEGVDGVEGMGASEGNGATAEPIAGKPARPASDELSLDRVFKEPPPSRGQEATSAFSFDQFFSESATDRGTAPATPATPDQPGAAQAPDDIEQFNAWLEGLKKS